MRVRDYDPADHAACMAVFDSNVPEYFMESERGDFSDFLHALGGPYLVIEDAAGEVVACGGHGIEPESGNARLCWGMARRSLHRTGLGRLLLDARLARIRAEGLAAVVELGTKQHTFSFFEQRGFRTVSVEPEGYGPGMDRYEMRLAMEDREADADQRATVLAPPTISPGGTC